MRTRSIAYPLVAASLVLPGFSTPSPAQEHQIIDTDLVRVRVETIATGLNHPWGIAILPDGRFLVTERNSGDLRIGNREGELSEPVEGVPDIFRYQGEMSQAGLFHVALHPQFSENRLVYLSYSQPSPEGAGTAIASGRLVNDGPSPQLEDVETIFSMNVHDSGGMHFGGRFVFDPRNNNIYLAIGDRGTMSRAQDPKDHAGKIIRIKDNGDTPPDNPFVNNPETDELIFSLGHRNVQGIDINPETGELWVNEHGPLGGDEINLIKPGRNYGWPIQTGGVDYSGAPIGRGVVVEGLEPPVHIWENTVAPSGLAIYLGDMFPQWRGDLLHGALATEGVYRTRIVSGKVEQVELMFAELGRRIRDVKVDQEGAIWLVTDHENGEVLRITPEEPVATGTIPRQLPSATGDKPGTHKE